MPDTHRVTNQLYSSTSGAEGPGHGPSKAGRTATGTKTGENVALADQKVRQWRNLEPKRGSSGTCRVFKAQRDATEATQMGMGVL